ncbi:hypothetical protein K1719_012147 [Acacia pycnantha]|nr:hypothetical protein K1719_012147 [Acacia pycnantha]
MACPGEGILTDLTQRLVDKTIKEVNYFRHFETHDQGFTQELRRLIGNLDKVQKDIDDAKTNNQNQIRDEVQHWIDEARNLVQNKSEIKQTRFDSWCPLIRKYRQGKRLAQRTLAIKDLNIGGHFEIVAHPAELLDKEYHASKDFIDFESRKTKFKQLVDALEDGNHYMIGLQGMGGTGKTTLATQVRKQVEESKAFEKVIFVVVSNPPNVDQIRGDIARQLGLRLEESEEVDRSKSLWSSIYKNEKKLLIILDDVWEELNLREIGIPSGLHHNNCYVLITTRRRRVCLAMRCQPIVCLHTLGDEDALTLFLSHARSNDSKGLARDFVKECGGLPIAIVALGSVLRNWPEGEWNVALTTLRDSKSLVDVDDDLVTVYTCLKLSYDNLNDKKAKDLFLLCSIFPEDYEIPTSLITRLGIGSGIFGEVYGYCAAKCQALSMKNKLIESSLLQKVGEKECVKMHDLVREVAQWIAKEEIQVIKNSRTTLKTNKRFVFWSTDDFPDQFDDTKLEILLLWISGDVLVKDPNAFFAGMSRLKILFLLGEYDRKVHSPLLLKSLLSLKDIHTLILDGWELGDISILKNIQSLVTLEFKNCLIIELPKNIMELKKLRWLGMRKCEIQKNNPFKVIEKCSQLDEVYFVGNFNVEDWNIEDDKEIEDEIAQDISPAKLQIFSIAYDGFKLFSGDDNGLLRCFNPEHIRDLIPDAMFKYLVRGAEVLESGRIGQTTWKNLAPDIIPLENGGMDNLIKLYLYEWDDIECLVDNKVELGGVPSLISIFQNCQKCVLRPPLVLKEDSKEKHENSKTSAFSWAYGCCFQVPTIDTNIGVPNATVKHHTISQGSCGSSKRMETVHTAECLMRHPLSLQNIREMKLCRCSKLKSLFTVSIATTMIMLEMLTILEGKELKDIVTNEDLQEFNKRSFLHLMASLQGQQLNVTAPKDLMKIIKDVQKLTRLRIRDSKIEECLFSISTCGTFPTLEFLEIVEASELEQVFIHKQDDMQKKTTRDVVFPKLSGVYLGKLPMLITICEGIDFQNVSCSLNDCPKYQGVNRIQEGPEDEDSENQAATNASLDFVEELKDEHKTSESIISCNKRVLKKPKLLKRLIKPIYHFLIIIDAISKERAEEGSILEDVVATTMVADLAPRNSWELEDEHKTIESTMQLQKEDLAEIKTTIEASQKINTPLGDYSIDVTLK